jgi:multisubunit Na+/H+ antiporter MnhC subunit
MQYSTIVSNLRLTGLIIGFAIFAFTMVRLIQHDANPDAAQNVPTITQLASK